MYYINTESNQYPINEGFIRSQFTNTSFPKPFVAPAPYAFVKESSKPAFDPMIEEVIEVAPVKTESGWFQAWEIKPLPAETVAANQQKAYEQRAAEIRASRNDFLKQSDWTQVDDAPVDKTAWAAYRQSLRDVPTQEGFPWDVTWPKKP